MKNGLRFFFYCLTQSFFSWLGVTLYLTRRTVLDTLQNIAGMAPTGSIIIFDYMDADAFIPERTEKSIQLMQEVVYTVYLST